MTWGIWQIFTRALRSLQIRTLMASFCLKLKIYELKIYRGVLCHGNEELCKIWRGTDLSVQNWHEEFDEFWPEHSKITKICTLMGCIWPKYIMFVYNIMGQLFLFFLCNFSSFFSYVGGIPLPSHISLLLTERYILAIQQTITHKEHLRYSLWPVAIFWIFFFFFLSGFYFTNIHESQDCRGRAMAFL